MECYGANAQFWGKHGWARVHRARIGHCPASRHTVFVAFIKTTRVSSGDGCGIGGEACNTGEKWPQCFDPFSEPGFTVFRWACLRAGACYTAQTEVCGAQDQLERVFLQLLQSPLKLICSPIQTTLAECYVALFEWGDCRKLPDALHNLLKIVASKADVSNRVYVQLMMVKLTRQRLYNLCGCRWCLLCCQRGCVHHR